MPIHYDGKPVTADDLQATGCNGSSIKRCVKAKPDPDLGAHTGTCSWWSVCQYCTWMQQLSVLQRQHLKLADYVITEAGFGADLGAEKFFDIKCRKAGSETGCSGSSCNNPRFEIQWRSCERLNLSAENLGSFEERAL